jgi:hypothetical protein
VSYVEKAEMLRRMLVEADADIERLRRRAEAAIDAARGAP